MTRSKNLQIYVHIPFCIRKCLYCDFLSGPQKQETIEKYVDALVKEIKMQNVYGALNLKECKNTVSTIFIGGGTPSVLSCEQMDRIFSALRNRFVFEQDVEISIEVNPGTVTIEKMQCFRNCGINRVSIGLQSANDEELKLLGRIHSYAEFLETYNMARACGFKNINVDLMSAIPAQTIQTYRETLEKIIALQPEHISSYSLIVEEETPFANLYGKGMPKAHLLPNEEDERRMYEMTEEMLSKSGYHRYEISNYALNGRECRHNLGYWERKEYLGFGLGASGLLGEVRYRNTDDLNFYITVAHTNTASLIVEREPLSNMAQMEEYFFLGMRKMEGVSVTGFEEQFQRSIGAVYGRQIENLQREGLIVLEGDSMRLTRKGIDVSNYVFAEFIN